MFRSVSGKTLTFLLMGCLDTFVFVIPGYICDENMHYQVMQKSAILLKLFQWPAVPGR